jgi:hypothetical protein
MKYKYENIDRFMEYKTWSDQQKIDELLHIDCNLYANLGTDSTKRRKTRSKTQKFNNI